MGSNPRADLQQGSRPPSQMGLLSVAGCGSPPAMAHTDPLRIIFGDHSWPCKDCRRLGAFKIFIKIY